MWRFGIGKFSAAAIISLSLMYTAPFVQADSAATQPSTAPGAALQVLGKVPHPLSLSLDQLAAFDHVTVNVNDRKGNPVSYRGVPLEEILKAAGVQFGQMSTARSDAAMCLVVSAADGYKVLFSLAELDPQFQKHLVVLADEQNGKPLDPAFGPLRIIAPDEAVHARWVRQVLSLTVAEP